MVGFLPGSEEELGEAGQGQSKQMGNAGCLGRVIQFVSHRKIVSCGLGAAAFKYQIWPHLHGL